MVVTMSQVNVKLDSFLATREDTEEVPILVTLGPKSAAPFSEDAAIARVVNTTITFHKRVLGVFDLGEGLPPIAAWEGERPIANKRCEGHEGVYDYRVTKDCEDCREARRGDETTTGYTVGSPSHSFNTLGEALGYALALRDRKNPNDAEYTARCINRLLVGEDFR